MKSFLCNLSEIPGRALPTLVLVSVFLMAPASAGLRHTGGASNAWDMPPIVAEDLGGTRRNLYDWRGRVIVLNFWATWCGPCQAEIPHLIRYQEEFGGQGLQVIGYALDERRKVNNFARTLGINYPVLIGDPASDGKLLPLWGDPNRVLPFTVVIGRDGHIEFMQVGILDEESFNDYIRPLLGNGPPGPAEISGAGH